MDFWYWILILDYIISVIGLASNLLYFKLVVVHKSYDGYWRIASFIISSGMFMLILSHIVRSVICLAYDGSPLVSKHCGKTTLYNQMDYLKTYGEYSVAAGTFIMVFERYGSVFFPSARLTSKYKFWFSGLVLLYLTGLSGSVYLMRINPTAFNILSGYCINSLLFGLSFVITIHLFSASKKQYYKTLGKLPLSQRYLLSESYELCQNCFVATFASLVINVTLCISFWLFVLNIIPFGFMYQYFQVYDIVLNISATLYPILFIHDSKKIERKINAERNKNDRVASEIRQLNGNRINRNPTQEDYFRQLVASWS